jgi:ATP synthase protein I
MSKLDSPWKAFVFVGTIGVELAIASILGYWCGKMLDLYLGTRPLFLMIGLLTGLGLGIYGVVLLINRFYGDEK